jgi:hypothetical protein
MLKFYIKRDAIEISKDIQHVLYSKFCYRKRILRVSIQVIFW